MRVLENVKNRQESRKKILLFSQVVLYHKFRKNLAISAVVGWLPPSTRREEQGLVATRPSATVRVPHRVELYGPLTLGALVAELSTYV